MRQHYEVRSCTASLDHGQSVDGKVYTNLHAAQRAADAWEAQYGEDCYVHILYLCRNCATNLKPMGIGFSWD